MLAQNLAIRVHRELDFPQPRIRNIQAIQTLASDGGIRRARTRQIEDGGL